MLHSHEPSFSDQLILEQGEIIFFHDGKLENGKDFYLYLAVKGTKLKEYFLLLKSATVGALDDLKKVGSIVAFGEGIPSEELRQHLYDKYGVVNS